MVTAFAIGNISTTRFKNGPKRNKNCQDYSHTNPNVLRISVANIPVISNICNDIQFANASGLFL
jgi:hypothetical protein